MQKSVPTHKYRILAILTSEIGPDLGTEPVGRRSAASRPQCGMQIWKSFIQMSVFQPECVQIFTPLQLSPVMDVTHLHLLGLVHQAERKEC